jgi:hypothetical protein
MFKKLLLLDLQLFAEGGAEGASGTSAQSNDGNSLGDAGLNPQSQVENGSVIENQSEPNEEVDFDAEFAELIKSEGKYANSYQKNLTKHLGERTKGLKEKLRSAEKTHREYSESVNPVLDKLADKYGTTPGDIEALNKAIESDGAFYDDAALKAGMSPEEYKVKCENERLTRQMQENHNRQVAQQRVQGWITEAEQLKQTYPGFDLESEMENATFAGLLANGFPMKNAYEAVHLDDLLKSAMTQTAQNIEQKVSNSVKANQNRPVENGVSSQSASKVRRDVSSMSYDEMDEVMKEVRRGKKITFRNQ